MRSIRSSVSGEPLALDLPSGAPTSVAELRSAVGAAIGIGVRGVALLCRGVAVEDGQDLPPDAEEALSFAVAWGPPERLAAHIVRPGSLHAVRNGMTFPEPQGIQINMMPFAAPARRGRRHLLPQVIGDKGSVPWEYQHYWDLVKACPCHSDNGKVGFLTISEGQVRQGESQRRSGLHVDMSGVLHATGSSQHILLHWGGGGRRRYRGGIYMASSVSDSCEIWDARIERPEEVLGRLGDAEHLRELLGPGKRMQAGELYWLSDVTPHESLPMEQDTYRQYFRLVTSSVAVWYSQHSTANRLGVECDPKVTRICSQDKFSGAAPELDPAGIPDVPCGEEYSVDLGDFDDIHQDLGLRVYVEPDSGSALRLRVWYVADGGVVWHWNKLHPDRRVAAKWQILAVNDISGEEFQVLLREIQKTGHINGCRRMKVSTLLVRSLRLEPDGGAAGSQALAPTDPAI